jgi:hypothetical protein
MKTKKYISNNLQGQQEGLRINGPVIKEKGRVPSSIGDQQVAMALAAMKPTASERSNTNVIKPLNQKTRIAVRSV